MRVGYDRANYERKQMEDDDFLPATGLGRPLSRIIRPRWALQKRVASWLEDDRITDGAIGIGVLLLSSHPWDGQIPQANIGASRLYLELLIKSFISSLLV